MYGEICLWVVGFSRTLGSGLPNQLNYGPQIREISTYWTYLSHFIVFHAQRFDRTLNGHRTRILPTVTHTAKTLSTRNSPATYWAAERRFLAVLAAWHPFLTAIHTPGTYNIFLSEEKMLLCPSDSQMFTKRPLNQSLQWPLQWHLLVSWYEDM